MRGKRILFATFGSLGDLYPYLALATEMQRRGHRATILTSSQHRSRIERSGVEFQQAAPDLDFSNKTFQERATREVTGGRYMLRDVIFPQIRASFDNLLNAASQADLLVTQMLAYAGPLVAEKTGIPWVSTVLAPLSFFSYEDSPVLAPSQLAAGNRTEGECIYQSDCEVHDTAVEQASLRPSPGTRSAAGR